MTTVWSGLSVGSLYAIVAIGFQLPLALAGVFNFAQGTLMVAGSYLVWDLAEQHGLAMWIATIISGVACAVIGAVIELAAIRPLAGRKGHAALVTTLGASVIIDGCILVIFGSTPHHLEFGSSQPLDWLGGRLEVSDAVIIASGLVAALAVAFAARRTRLGISGRAATEDPVAAIARGVRFGRIRLAAFTAAGLLAGIAGPLVGAKVSVDFSVGPTLVVFGFVALAIGGFGSFMGSWIGGLVVGLAQAYAALFLGSSYPTIVVFLLLLVVLLIRPTGLFGTRNLRAL